MDDTPAINDGADASLRKAVSLLNKIEAKTGSGSASGPASGTVALDATSLAALENISVTFPATQNVNVTNAGLNVSVTNLPATQPVSGTFWPTTQPISGSVSVTNLPATQPVSIANPPVTPVTDNGGSLTVDGSLTATQATAASLKAQAQLLNAAGSVVDYAMTGTAGTPASDVVSVQGVSGGTVIPVSGAVTASQATPSNLKAQVQLIDASGTQISQVSSGTAGAPSVDVLTVQGSTSGTPIPVRLTASPVGTYSVVTTFQQITSTIIAEADGDRKGLTIFNEGNGPLYIKPAASTVDSVSTTSYQIRMSPGDYWEVPAAQVPIRHLGIFASGGTARITVIK